MPRQPQSEDFNARLMRDYAQPRQYSGYSAGAPTPEPAQAMPGGIPASMFEDPNVSARNAGLRRFMPEQGPPMPGSNAELRADMNMPTLEEDSRTKYAQLNRQIREMPEASPLDEAIFQARMNFSGNMNNLARDIGNYFRPPAYQDPIAGFTPGRGAVPMGAQLPNQMLAARPQNLDAFAMAPRRTAEREGFYSAVPQADEFYPLR